MLEVTGPAALMAHQKDVTREIAVMNDAMRSAGYIHDPNFHDLKELYEASAG